MWIIRWILVAVVIVVILLFSLQNQEEQVMVNLFGWESPFIPLYFALFIAFVVGLFVWFIVATFQILQLKAELRTCRREKRTLEGELTALRNLPLEESGEDHPEVEPPQEMS